MNEKQYLEAAKTLGTPCYLFDCDLARETAEFYRRAFGGRVKICYAVKANPFLVGALKDTADYFEACSHGEYKICMRAGVRPEKLVISGVMKRESEIAEVLDACGGAPVYTAESLDQWEMIKSLAAAKKIAVKVIPRLSCGNQFGMCEGELLEIIGGKRGGAAYGVHYFAGTQKKSVSHASNELKKLDEMLASYKKQHCFEAQRLEYGPGIPESYFDGETDCRNEIIAEISAALAGMEFKNEIVFEMGRAVAAGCGAYITTAADLKRSDKASYCITDGGINGVNYFGQMMGMKSPPVRHIGAGGTETEKWTVCGALCTGNDILLRSYPFDSLQKGDLIVFEKAGAYSVTEGIALFLSRDIPAVGLWSAAGGLAVARRRIYTDNVNSCE